MRHDLIQPGRDAFVGKDVLEVLVQGQADEATVAHGPRAIELIALDGPVADHLGAQAGEVVVQLHHRVDEVFRISLLVAEAVEREADACEVLSG